MARPTTHHCPARRRASRSGVALVAIVALAAVLGSDLLSARPAAAATQPRALVGPGGIISVGVRPSLDRPRPGVRTEGLPGRIVLTAARGERESAWMVVHARRGATFRFVPTALTGPGGARIGAGRIRVHYARPTSVAVASPGGRRGQWLDPLLPMGTRPIRVPAGSRSIYWVDVEVPRSVPAGAYRGTIVIRRDDGSVLARLPVRVAAHRVRLSSRPRLQTSFGLDWKQVDRFERPANDAARRTKFRQYVAMLAAARVTTADSYAAIPGAVEGRDPAGDRAMLDWIGRRPGSSALRVPMYPSWPVAEPTGRDRAAAIRYLRAAVRYYRSRGWLGRVHVYAVDEPGPADVARLRRWHALLSDAHPGLRLLVSTAPNARMRPYVDIWTVNLSRAFRPSDVRAEKRRGRGFWLYPSISSAAPWPSPFIDDARPSWRAMGWMAWRYSVDGISYWDTNNWDRVANPWTNTATFVGDGVRGNGDGSLLYPGRPVGHDGPVPSLRLLQLRDGIEDHELLARAAACGSRRLAAERARALAASPTDFSTSAEAVRRSRALLLGAIARAEAAGRRC